MHNKSIHKHLVTSLVCLATLLCVAIFTQGVAADETSFEPREEYFFNTDGIHNTFSRCVAAGDVDGDGAPDVVVGDRFSNEILLLINCGEGTLLAPRVISSAGSSHNRIIALEDVNADGMLDIASASGKGAAIFLNLGLSKQGDWLGFSKVTLYDAGVDPHWIDVVDINGDDQNDLLVANFGSEGFETGWHLFLNKGEGTFATGIEFNLGMNARCISIIGEDLDGDGDSDIVVATQSGFLYVYENLGTTSKGNWIGANLKKSIEIEISICSLRSIDIELDGDVDLAIAHRSQPRFTLINNSGAWNFELETVDAPLNSELVEPADVNGDGFTDLTVVNKMLGTFHVYLNDGKGQFAMDYVSDLNTMAAPKFMAYTDLDQDGDVDSILVNSYPSVDWGSINVSMNELIVSRNRDTGCYLKIWTVDDDGPADFDSIQVAIDTASDGDEIVVMPGIYTSTSSSLINLLGKGIWLHSINGPEVTIIDGQDQNCLGILCQSNESNETIIEGFTITNCLNEENGGGMLCDSSSPTVRNCHFIANASLTNSGGGLCNISSNTELYDCVFEDNSAVQGGGVANINSNPIFVGCQIKANTASLGGGMHNETSNTTLINCLLCENNPDHIAGKYIDGGGNTFAGICLIDCPDFNEDSIVDIGDLLQLLDAWGQSGVVEDINYDGIVDVGDLLLVIGHWGPCE